jgi:hypothetical protein
MTNANNMKHDGTCSIRKNFDTYLLGWYEGTKPSDYRQQEHTSLDAAISAAVQLGFHTAITKSGDARGVGRETIPLVRRGEKLVTRR